MYKRQDLFDTVYDQLPDQTAQDQWTDLDLVWEDREYILALDAFHLPELDYFLAEFLPAFPLTLDELQADAQA